MKKLDDLLITLSNNKEQTLENIKNESQEIMNNHLESLKVALNTEKQIIENHTHAMMKYIKTPLILGLTVGIILTITLGLVITTLMKKWELDKIYQAQTNILMKMDSAKKNPILWSKIEILEQDGAIYIAVPKTAETYTNKQKRVLKVTE